MKKTKKIAAAVPAMTMAAGPVVTGCFGKGGSTDTDPAAVEQPKETAGSAGESKDDAAKADDGALHLTLYCSVNVGGSTVQLIEKICADFNAENLDIFVEPVYTDSYDDTVTKIQTAIQGGMPSDVFVSPVTQRPTTASTGMAMPLDELIEADGDEGKVYTDDFLPGFMEDSYMDGKIYPISFQRSTMVLHYNKDVSKKAGLDPEAPPTIWEELAEYGQKLTNDGRYGVGIVLNFGSTQWTFTGFCLQNSTDGQNLMSKDGKNVYFDTPENVEAPQFWLDLQNECKYMAEGIIQWTDLSAQFLAGEVATIYRTTGSMANIHDNAGSDFGTAFLSARKRVGAPTGGGNFYISSNVSEDRAQAAQKLIKLATSMDRAAQWSLDTGYVATRQSCFDMDLIKDYYAEVPQASAAYEQLPYTEPEPTTYDAVEIWRVLNDNIQAAVVGDVPAQEALDAAQEQAEEVLSEYQQNG